MGKNKKYSASLKLKAVKLFLEGEKSGSVIAEELRISSFRMVEKWVKIYEKYGKEGFVDKRGKLTGPTKGRPKKSSEQSELEFLRAKVALLEALVEHGVKKK
jgi:transposase